METINTFVFLVSKRSDFIFAAIDTLRAHTPGNYKIIIVNQSRYNKKMEKDLWVESDLIIRTRLNYGFAKGANMGMELAQTEYVTIANDDVVFFWDGWWDGIMQTFQKYDNALGVCPMSPKEPGWGYGEPGYRMHATLEECLDAPENTVKRLTAMPQFNGTVVDGIAMWLVTFKRKEWKELGMFDERFRLGGGEDYDALGRAYQAGYRMLGTSFSWVWHHWGQSTTDFSGPGVALPPSGPSWNKLSTKGFGDEGLWHPDLDVWGRDCERTDPNVYRAPL